jgi:hypothetical protein
MDIKYDDIVTSFTAAAGGKLNPLHDASSILGEMGDADATASVEETEGTFAEGTFEYWAYMDSIDAYISFNKVGEIVVSYGAELQPIDEHISKVFTDNVEAWRFFKGVLLLGEFSVFMDLLY